MNQKQALEHFNITRFLPPPWISAVALAIGAVWIARELREIVVLLVVGYSIAYIIEPAIQYLQKKGFPRTSGFLYLSLIAVLLLIILGLTVIPRLLEEGYSLISNFPSYISRAQSAIYDRADTLQEYLPDTIRGTTKLSERIDGMLNQTSVTQVLEGDILGNVLSAVFGTLLRGYSVTLTVVNLALLPFIVYYISIDFKRYHYSALMLFPKGSRHTVRSLFRQVDKSVSAYVRGQLLIGSILACLYGTGLALIGVELWVPIALLSGYGNLVPYLGTAVGIVIASVMGVVTFGDFYHVIQIWILYGVVQFCEGTFITPKVMGDRVGLSPLTVILALFAGGNLFGLLGIFLAVPALAMIKVLAIYLGNTWFRARGGGLTLPTR